MHQRLGSTAVPLVPIATRSSTAVAASIASASSSSGKLVKYELKPPAGHELRSDLGPCAEFYPRHPATDPENTITLEAIGRGYALPPVVADEWGSLREAAAPLEPWRLKHALLRTMYQIDCLRGVPAAPETLSTTRRTDQFPRPVPGTSSSATAPSKPSGKLTWLADAPKFVTTSKHGTDPFLKDLAGLDKPLAKLAVSHGLRNNALIASLCEAGVPVVRAMWLVKAVYKNLVQQKKELKPAIEWGLLLVSFMHDKLKQGSPQTHSFMAYTAKLLSYSYHEGLIDRLSLFTQFLESAADLKLPEHVMVWAVLLSDYVADMAATTTPKIVKKMPHVFAEMVSKLTLVGTPYAHHLCGIFTSAMQHITATARHAGPLLPKGDHRCHSSDFCSATRALDSLEDHNDTARALHELVPITDTSSANEVAQVVCNWAVTGLRSHFLFRELTAANLLAHIAAIPSATDEKPQFPLQAPLSQFLEEFVPSSDAEKEAVAVLFGCLIRLRVFSHDMFVRRLISCGLLEHRSSEPTETAKRHRYYLLSFPIVAPVDGTAHLADDSRFQRKDTQALSHQRNQRRAILDSMSIGASKEAVAKLQSEIASLFTRQLSASGDCPEFLSDVEKLTSDLRKLPLHDMVSLSDWAADLILPRRCHCSGAVEGEPCLCKPTAWQLRSAVALLEASNNFVTLAALLLRVLHAPEAREKFESLAVVIGAIRKHLPAFVRLGYLPNILFGLAGLASPAPDSVLAKPGTVRVRIGVGVSLRDGLLKEAKSLFALICAKHGALQHVKTACADIPVSHQWAADDRASPVAVSLLPGTKAHADAAASCSDATLQQATSDLVKDIRASADQLAPLVAYLLQLSSSSPAERMAAVFTAVQTFQAVSFIGVPMVKDAILRAVRSLRPMDGKQLALIEQLSSRGTLRPAEVVEGIVLPSMAALLGMPLGAPPSPQQLQAIDCHVVLFDRLISSGQISCHSISEMFVAVCSLFSGELGHQFSPSPAVVGLLSSRYAAGVVCSSPQAIAQGFQGSDVRPLARWKVLQYALRPVFEQLRLPWSFPADPTSPDSIFPALGQALAIVASEPGKGKWAFGAAFHCVSAMELLHPGTDHFMLLSLQKLADVCAGGNTGTVAVLCEVICNLIEFLGPAFQGQLLQAAESALEYQASFPHLAESLCRSTLAYANDRLGRQPSAQQPAPSEGASVVVPQTILFGDVLSRVMASTVQSSGAQESTQQALQRLIQAVFRQLQSFAAQSASHPCTLEISEILQASITARLKILESAISSLASPLPRLQLLGGVGSMIAVLASRAVQVDVAGVVPAVAHAIGLFVSRLREQMEDSIKMEDVYLSIRMELDKLSLSTVGKKMVERFFMSSGVLPMPVQVGLDESLKATMPEALRINPWNLVEEVYDTSAIFPTRMPRAQMAYGPRPELAPTPEHKRAFEGGQQSVISAKRHHLQPS